MHRAREASPQPPETEVSTCFCYIPPQRGATFPVSSASTWMCPVGDALLLDATGIFRAPCRLSETHLALAALDGCRDRIMALAALTMRVESAEAVEMGVTGSTVVCASLATGIFVGHPSTIPSACWGVQSSSNAAGIGFCLVFCRCF